MNKINLSLLGREWVAVSPISSCIVSMIFFAWFVIELDDLPPLVACVIMACKAIYDVSMINAED